MLERPRYQSGYVIQDQMEGPKNKVTMVVAEINRVNEENHKLRSMVKIMTSKYNNLQKHIRSLVQQQKHGHGSQVYVIYIYIYIDILFRKPISHWDHNVKNSYPLF